MMTDGDVFTPHPWSVADHIFTVKGRAGQTTVATLRDGALAKLLAAAPDLLYAVEESKACLKREEKRLMEDSEQQEVFAEQLAVSNAWKAADLAIAAARVGRANSATQERPLWTVNPKLPDSEREANKCLLAAAEDLWDAAMKAFPILARRDPEYAAVVALLCAAMLRSGRVLPR